MWITFYNSLPRAQQWWWPTCWSQACSWPEWGGQWERWRSRSSGTKESTASSTLASSLTGKHINNYPNPITVQVLASTLQWDVLPLCSEEIAFYNGNEREKLTIHSTFKKLVSNTLCIFYHSGISLIPFPLGMFESVFRVSPCLFSPTLEYWPFSYFLPGGPLASIYLLPLLHGICGQHDCQV